MKKATRVTNRKPSNQTASKSIPFRIFFSHKDKDEADFRAITKELELAYGRRVDVFIAERMAAREVWFKTIMEKICRCDHCVLVYTNPSLSWDFPIFECGVRTGWEFAESLDTIPKVTVIHHEKAVCPSPLSQWQAIDASSKNTIRLDGFLLEIHAAITQKKCDTLEETGKPFRHLKKIRGMIARLLEEGLQDSHVPVPEIRVRLPSAKAVIDSPKFKNMPIELNTTMAILLGAKESVFRWKDFTESIRSKCSFTVGWLECMLDAIERSSKDTELAYPLPLIRLKRDRTVFELRPNLNAIRKSRNKEVEACIAFSLRPSTSTEEGDGMLHKVMEFLNGTKRIRVTALPSFFHKARELQKEERYLLNEVRMIAFRTHIAITNIVEEAYGSGYEREEILTAIKGEKESEELVRALFRKWDEEKGVFKIEGTSLVNTDAKSLLSRLESTANNLEEINLQFARRASMFVANYFEANVPDAPTPSKSLLQSLGFPFWPKDRRNK